MESIEKIIKNTTEENQSKTEWTKACSFGYPTMPDEFAKLIIRYPFVLEKFIPY